MPEIFYQQEDDEEPIVVDLRDPKIAALLAWLFPGAGHFYQRRFAKGFLFMICVLITYFIGLGLGHGRVVYASFKKEDFRWQYCCQLGVGALAMPAIVQAMKVKNDAPPFFVLCERFPADYAIESKATMRITEQSNPEKYDGPTLKDGFMAPPPGPIFKNARRVDSLARWHFDYKHYFDLGTVYTIVAGLLNLLAIYDAYCGPAILTPAQRERLESKKQKIKD